MARQILKVELLSSLTARKFAFIAEALGYNSPDHLAENILADWLQTVRRFPGWHDSLEPEKKGAHDGE